MKGNKYILVTGGAGYIGSHTIIRLVELGYKPVIADDFRNSDYRVIEGIRKITGEKPVLHELDVCDRDKLDKLFNTYNFSGVIHFAANKSVSESVRKPLKYYRNNISSLINVLELAEKHNVKNFVFSSSCTVYGEPDEETVTEDSPWKEPASPYGATKQMCEEIIKDLHQSGSILNLLCLRYFNPIGAHPSAELGEFPTSVPDNLLPYITQTAIGKREKLTVYGNDYPTADGTCIRDFIHIMDLAEAHTSGLIWLETKDESVYEVLNVGTGKGTSILEIINTFEKVSNVKLNWEFGERRPGDVARIFANADKAKDLIGWKAERTNREAVFDAWNWELKLKGEK